MCDLLQCRKVGWKIWYFQWLYFLWKTLKRVEDHILSIILSLLPYIQRRFMVFLQYFFNHSQISIFFWIFFKGQRSFLMPAHLLCTNLRNVIESGQYILHLRMLGQFLIAFLVRRKLSAQIFLRLGLDWFQKLIWVGLRIGVGLSFEKIISWITKVFLSMIKKGFFKSGA